MWEHISRSIYLFIENNSGLLLLYSLCECECVWVISLAWMVSKRAKNCTVDHSRHAARFLVRWGNIFEPIHMHFVYDFIVFSVKLLHRFTLYWCLVGSPNAWLLFSVSLTPIWMYSMLNGCIQCTSTCSRNILFSGSYYVIANETKPTRTKSAFVT